MTPSLELASSLLFAAVVIYGVELFVPSAGILFVLGTLCTIGSLFVAFQVGPYTGAAFLSLSVVMELALLALMLNFWTRTPLGRRMMLRAAEPAEEPADIEAAEHAPLIGKVGKAVTPLRPAGICELDGRRVDVVSEGMLIEVGEWVKVARVEGARVVVRKHKPEAFDADFNIANDLIG